MDRLSATKIDNRKPRKALLIHVQQPGIPMKKAGSWSVAVAKRWATNFQGSGLLAKKLSKDCSQPTFEGKSIYIIKGIRAARGKWGGGRRGSAIIGGPKSLLGDEYHGATSGLLMKRSAD